MEKFIKNSSLLHFLHLLMVMPALQTELLCREAMCRSNELTHNIQPRSRSTPTDPPVIGKADSEWPKCSTSVLDTDIRNLISLLFYCY